MKIEIEAHEVIDILTGLNTEMFEKCRLIAEGYEEQIRRKNEDDLKWNANSQYE